jgi:hypothetical protein
MSVVVSLTDWANRDTVDTLIYLLELAKAGQLSGSGICFTTSDGNEKSVFTGHYKTDPARGVNAAMRLSWKLTQAQDDAEASRSK